MNKTTLWHVAGAVFVASVWPTGASAQVNEIVESGSSYTVEFEDGDLLGNSTNAIGFVIPIRDTKMRVLLIRPRASFVPELTKSVEHM